MLIEINNEKRIIAFAMDDPLSENAIEISENNIPEDFLRCPLMYSYDDGAFIKNKDKYVFKIPDAELEIENLKNELTSTDYKALKYSDGALTDEEYEPIRQYRQSLRDRINQLETQI